MAFFSRSATAPSSPLDDPGTASAEASAAPPGERPAPGLPEKRRLPGLLAALRRELRPKLLTTADEADGWTRGDPDKEALLRRRLHEHLGSVTIGSAERATLEAALFDDLLGFGAIQALVRDPTVSEIMVNGPDVVFVERDGTLAETADVFDDETHLRWTAQRIVRPLQRHLDRANPAVDARLPDGSRVHIVMPPAAVHGTIITIRKFPCLPLTIHDLIRFGSFSEDVARFFEMCVVGRLNIVVSGGTSSGKTTLLNVLSAFIPAHERIVTIEDAAELQLTQRNVVSLETTPALPGGDGRSGLLTIRDLVRASLRMRPDRIVVGECRGAETLDMLQAMNTGHDGSLTTVHANSPRDALSRLETLCMMAGVDLPLLAIRRQMASAVHLIIQQSRLADGSRRIVQVSEIEGTQGDVITMQDLFVYRAAGAGGAAGGLESTGLRPHFVDRLSRLGVQLDTRLFASR
jgi:pilus assembly protein CpaF